MADGADTKPVPKGPRSARSDEPAASPHADRGHHSDPYYSKERSYGRSDRDYEYERDYPSREYERPSRAKYDRYERHDRYERYEDRRDYGSRDEYRRDSRPPPRREQRYGGWDRRESRDRDRESRDRDRESRDPRDRDMRDRERDRDLRDRDAREFNPRDRDFNARDRERDLLDSRDSRDLMDSRFRRDRDHPRDHPRDREPLPPREPPARSPADKFAARGFKESRDFEHRDISTPQTAPTPRLTPTNNGKPDLPASQPPAPPSPLRLTTYPKEVWDSVGQKSNNRLTYDPELSKDKAKGKRAIYEEIKKGGQGVNTTDDPRTKHPHYFKTSSKSNKKPYQRLPVPRFLVSTQKKR